MYKGKPVVIISRPWWRHPVLPWGWYSITRDRINGEPYVEADGYYRPGDGGAGRWLWERYPKGENGGPLLIQPNEGIEGGVYVKKGEVDGMIKFDWYKILG